MAVGATNTVPGLLEVGPTAEPTGVPAGQPPLVLAIGPHSENWTVPVGAPAPMVPVTVARSLTPAPGATALLVWLDVVAMDAGLRNGGLIDSLRAFICPQGDCDDPESMYTEPN